MHHSADAPGRLQISVIDAWTALPLAHGKCLFQLRWHGGHICRWSYTPVYFRGILYPSSLSALQMVASQIQIVQSVGSSMEGHQHSSNPLQEWVEAVYKLCQICEVEELQNRVIRKIDRKKTKQIQKIEQSRPARLHKSSKPQIHA